MWNGVLLAKEDAISESTEIVGLIGTVPADETEDTGSIQMIMTVVFMLNDNGEATQILSIAEEPDDGGDEGPGEGEDPCDETLDVYFKDSTTWAVSSIDNDADYFNYDANAGYHHGTFTCEDSPSENMTVSYSRVVEEPEPTVNTPPTCDVYWYGSDDSLADGKEGGHEADEGTTTGDFDIELTEGATYTLMFYCDDAEGDELTVTVDPSIGNTKTMTGNGSLSGYYEFAIPTGTSALGEMSFDYDWTDGTNIGNGTVTVNVLEGSDAGGDDDTKSDDTSAGSFVPGFTAVLTITALAGAFLVFSRREEE